MTRIDKARIELKRLGAEFATRIIDGKAVDGWWIGRVFLAATSSAALKVLRS